MIYLGKNPVGVSNNIPVIPIDDAAGSGDYTKVWSANKSATVLQQIQEQLGGLAFNGGYCEENPEDGKTYLHLTLDDTELDTNIFTPIEIPAGRGGGGGTSTAVITCTNTTGWSAATFAKGSTVILSLNWSSLDDGMPNGDGSLTVMTGTSTTNLVTKNVINVAQGDVTVDISEWLNDGANVIRLIITDVDGNIRSKAFNVQIENIYIASTFDSSTIQSGEITFPYTPWGEIEKIIHFSVDETELETVTVSTSGRQLTKVIPAQSHGSHHIRAWITGSINNTPISSNVLEYDIICIETGNTAPIIASDYAEETVTQYSTVVIPYMVYTPESQVSEVTISVNGTQVQTLSGIDRSMQSFSYRFDDPGPKMIVITSGTASKTIALTVEESDITIEPVNENLALYLSSKSRSNSEANPATWTYGTGANQISCTLSGFNFISNGWMTDSDGVTALRINGEATVTIPYQIFANEFRTNGKTIEVEFATRDVRNYSAVLLDCMSGGRGLQITAQDCHIASEQSGLRTQFKEDEHVRLSFVVDKRSELRLIRCFIDGIQSAVVQYPENDDFTQVNPVNITIAGNGNTVDIYCIRIYDTDLTAQQIEENWIADTQDGALMLERYTRNNIRDQYGKIQASKLPSDLPYLIITAARLPQYKGDKLIVSGQYVDPMNPSKSFTFENAQIDVQGTSSQYYSRKNYKVKFNGGFTTNGVTTSKYKMRSDSIAVKTFCFKADVASSEGANNVELVRIYEDACPYKTPAQQSNNLVRQGIDGFPIVIFWNNTETGETTFLGKYNFNNDKSNEDVFGFTDGDESWEVRNNTSNRVIWRSDDYSGKAWLNDFEARYPDEDPAYEDPSQLQEFASWLRSTDPSQATGNTLATAVSYPSVVISYETHTDIDTGEISYEEVRTTVQVTYTNDTAEYRKAKFRAELEDYVELDSALFYYLFTELYLMVDSRAKNMFPSFMGSEIST